MNKEYVEALAEAVKSIRNAIDSINQDTNSILVADLEHVCTVITQYINDAQ